MTLREALLKVADEYAAAKTQEFTGHPLADHLRSGAPDALQRLQGAERWVVKGSAGAGVWAHVPWLAFLDPVVTESTQHGQYVVYLFAPRRREVYLSLNQGTTEMYQAFGEAMGRRFLADRASKMRALAAGYGAPTDVSRITLGESGKLPRGYEQGHAVGYRYQAHALPSEAHLRKDLFQLLDVYRQMTLDVNFGDDDLPDLGSTPTAPVSAADLVIERRRYVMHRRIERRRDIASKVKAKQGCTCRACGFQYTDRYGPLGEDFIEVHHLKPLSSLELETAVAYDLQKDFAVLCANCHRMIHRLKDVSDVAALQAVLQG
ncbi:MrcB family domain-containing protein [Deinococcus ficus]|uniref:MrcB family domain-containing protein n=1 Tax=Deinococcus ficus TaxID=317577 RepID=UPI0003FEF05E|nr:DUF3578 domain-containing protein [Deinococcus ficus]